ncbi:MAG: queuosine precursor transporter [Phycisphaerae bacterium]|nr:queuosine precursor transporter [Phycisphaerae bacterium]
MPKTPASIIGPMGYNEIIFLSHLTVAGAVLLAAARLGRMWVTGLIVTYTLLMNITVMKNMTILGMPVTDGNVQFATVFLASNVLNEHYGRPAAREAVWIAFFCGFAAVAIMHFDLWYAPNADDTAQTHLEYFFNVWAFPRIMIVSMISYLLSQLLDVQLYHLIRRRTGLKLMWLRSNGSTWISQAFDTVFFTTAALVGTTINTWPDWAGAVVFAYLVKILTAALNTPFLYLTTWRPLVPIGSQRSPTPGGLPDSPPASLVVPVESKRAATASGQPDPTQQ